MTAPPNQPTHWDLFCQVVDNFGDIGVCWRLACELGQRGIEVRLWVDDASALAWMAPEGDANVEVIDWSDPLPAHAPGAVVVEAFGCELPAAFVERIARCAVAPLWINLEYLSAETYVERSHRLPSPVMSGPGRGLTKWFFYPGFTRATGGLIREHDLMQRQATFDAARWLAAHGATPHANERVVSLFCYANASLPALLDRLAESPTLLLTTAGPATAQLAQVPPRPGLRHIALPWLTQHDYDHLLWSCDLNCVRGEDSFVRAQWAGRPLLWQAYPQHDAVHVGKLSAFLERMLDGADAGTAASVTRWHAAWNGSADASTIGTLPDLPSWRAISMDWRARLLAQADLVTQLLGFVAESR